MQLILAIVADQQQAAQLAALIDGRLAVDLVQAAEVGEGLLALDDRIPDLILTTPWMSPFDDGVLDEYLRDLGPAGAHVQTLRIPVLSQAPKKAPRLGFSLRRRAKPEPTTPVGCEPKVFADEIAQYLARAAEEKQHASTNEGAPVIERHVIQHEVTPQPIDAEQWKPAYSSDDVSGTAAWSAPEAETESNAWRSDLLDRPRAAESSAYEPHEVETIAAWQEDVVDTPAPVHDPTEFEKVAFVDAAAPAVESFEEPVAVDEQVVVEAIEDNPVAAFEEVPVVEATDTHVAALAEPVVVAPVAHVARVDPAIVEKLIVEKPIVTPSVVKPAAPSIVAPVEAEGDMDKATPSFKAALAAIRAAWGKPSATENSPAWDEKTLPAPRKEPVMPVVDAAGPMEVDLTGEVDLLDEATVELEQPSASVQRPFVPADSPEELEVYELSVEPDMKELESELVAPPPPEPSSDRRKKPAKRATKAAKAKSPRPSQPQAAQDEWGVFDPNRCGFAALVDKLDEVSDDKVEQPTPRGKARVISCS
jgi:hypothetical protein